MSIHAINAAYKAKAGSARNKAVLVALANHANDQGQCWPSVALLSDETELNEKTVRLSLADLVKRRLITRQPQFIGHSAKGRTTDLYTLCLDRQEAATPPGDTPAPPPGEAPAPSGRYARTTPGDTPGDSGRTGGDKKPSANRQMREATPSAPATRSKVIQFGKAKRSRPAPMPDDWQPDDATKQYGHDIGLTDAEIDADLARFKTRHTRTNPGKSADWQASAREWLDKNKLAHKPVAPEAPAKFAFDGKFFAPFNSEKWRAHDEYRRRTEGRGACHFMLPQLDGSKADGWYFDTPWPPDMSAAAQMASALH
jgi:hypothetical protein